MFKWLDRHRHQVRAAIKRDFPMGRRDGPSTIIMYMYQSNVPCYLTRIKACSFIIQYGLFYVTVLYL